VANFKLDFLFPEARVVDLRCCAASLAQPLALYALLVLFQELLGPFLFSLTSVLLARAARSQLGRGPVSRSGVTAGYD